MKLLMTGSDQVWSFERIYYKYLSEGTKETGLFPAQNHFYAWYNRSVLHKVIYRAGLSRIIPAINRQLREEVLRTSPDAVLVFKGMEILPETLEWMRSRRIFLANYNPDNPFIFSGYGSGNANVTRSIPLYDLHFTYNLEVKQKLESAYKARVAWLPFGFDVPEGIYEACRQQEEVEKLCFLGNPDKERAASVQSLLDNGIPVDVYGHGWDGFIRHANLQVRDAVYGDDFWKTLHRYRIQLNLMRVHNEQSHNMRSFEIPGIGGIQLAPDTPEHRQFFEPEREIFLFRDTAECTAQIKKILGLSKEDTGRIRQRARQRSLDSGYSYRDRAKTLLNEIRANNNLHAKI